MSISSRIRAGRSEGRLRTDLRARGEVEEVGLAVTVSAGRRKSSSPLKHKNQSQPPQLDLYVNHIFISAKTPIFHVLPFLWLS